jgi:hypothetical protein
MSHLTGATRHHKIILQFIHAVNMSYTTSTSYIHFIRFFSLSFQHLIVCDDDATVTATTRKSRSTKETLRRDPLERRNQEQIATMRRLMKLPAASKTISSIRGRSETDFLNGTLYVPPRAKSASFSTGALGVAAGVSMFFLLEEMEPQSNRLLSRIHGPDDTDNADVRLQQRKPEERKVRFPSLDSRLVTGRQNRTDSSTVEFPINAQIPLPIDNDLFVGEVSLLLRPLQPEHDPNFRDTFESLRESHLPNKGSIVGDTETPTFFFVLKGRFKRPIRRDALYVGGELADPYIMDRTLSGWSRKMATWFLKLLAIHVGPGMSYSFGAMIGNRSHDGSAQLPHITFPVRTAMHVQEEGELLTISQDHGDFWATGTTYTFTFEASSIDLATWKVLYPIDLDVSKFWGNAALRLVIYESPDALNYSSNNYLFELQVEHKHAFADDTLANAPSDQPLLPLSA